MLQRTVLLALSTILLPPAALAGDGSDTANGLGELITGARLHRRETLSPRRMLGRRPKQQPLRLPRMVPPAPQLGPEPE